MGYLKELRDQWRPLLAAMIGMGSGYSLAQYTVSIMAPQMIEEFNWSRGEFAAVGGLSLFTVFVFPIIGRITDTIGVRWTALIGVLSLPIGYLAITMMTGDIRAYMVIFVLQAIFCVTTTATVYTRIVVQYIKKARGLALAIAASGPAVTGAIGAPMLNNFVDAHGWREGYYVVAVFSVVAGAIALLMMPSERRKVDPDAKPHKRNLKEDFSIITKTPAFWVMIGGLLLVNLPQVLALTQMKLLLQENGAQPEEISFMLSAFATGILIGRFACGLALDRFPAHLVATIGLGLPSIGLFLIASSIDTPAALTMAVILLGLSFGAEGDVVAYLVVRNFGVGVYSTVMGLMTLTISTSTSLGAAFVGVLLETTGAFTLFVIICAFAVLFGALLFLLLGRPGAGAGAADSEPAEPSPAAERA